DLSGFDSKQLEAKDPNDVFNALLSYGLVELLLILLGDLEPPAIIRKGVEQSDNQDGASCSLKPCPYKGFRRDIVAHLLAIVCIEERLYKMKSTAIAAVCY
ncbi:ataxin-10, partial [Trifolium medium]|nr:ataxin-10 [Trifolium medium]